MVEAIIDTGPITAFFDGGDKYSMPFREWLQIFRGRLYTTLAVVTEVSYLLDDNKSIQIDFIEWIKNGAITIKEIPNDDFQFIHKYMRKYADTPMDFADASLVVLADKLKLGNIITFDSDFTVYRMQNGKKFNNLVKDI